MSTDRVEGTGWFAAPNWIFDRTDLRNTDKLAFLYLCRRAGADGRSWPSVRRMAQEVGVSRNTIRACLDRLEDAGLLRREARTSRAGDADSYVYHITRSEPEGVGQSVPHVGQSATTEVGQSESGVGQSRPHRVGQSSAGGGSIQTPEGLPEKDYHSLKERETGAREAEPSAETNSTDSLSPDFDSEPEPDLVVDEGLSRVMAHYRDAIGIMGPTQFEKLRFWVDEKGMPPDVVCAAIDVAVEQAERPGVGYIEAVLRNWYNDGVRTLADVDKRNRADPRNSRSLRRGEAVSSEEFAEALREAGAI